MKKSFNLKLKNMLQALIIVDMTSSIIVTFLIYDEREKQAMFPILDPTLYIGSLATKEQELVAYLTNKGLKKDSDYTLKVNANHAIITPTEKYKNKTTVIIALIKKLDLNTLPTNITLEGPFTEIGVFKKAIFETLKKTTNFTNLTLTNINITKADNT